MDAITSQADLNTLGVALLALGGGAYALYQKIRTDRVTEAAKVRGDAILELKETIERKDKEIAAEVERVDRYRNLLEESERARIAEIGKTREAMLAEEARQTQLRHDLRQEIRGANVRIQDLESENKHLKDMIAALTTRISALEIASPAIPTPAAPQS